MTTNFISDIIQPFTKLATKPIQAKEQQEHQKAQVTGLLDQKVQADNQKAQQDVEDKLRARQTDAIKKKILYAGVTATVLAAIVIIGLAIKNSDKTSPKPA